MQEIHKLKCYIEIQIRELNAKFDLEWKEWLQNKKLTIPSIYSNSFDRLSSTLPHSSFIINDNEMEDNVAGMAYKALIKNQQLIENLRKQIDFICKKMFIFKKEKRLINEKLNDDVELLSQFLCKTSLNVPKKSDQVITIQCLSNERKNILKRFLEKRHTVPIIVCRSSVDNSSFNQKSRFISVLEKIKEKTKKTNKIIENNIVAEEKKEKPKIEDKSSPLPMLKSVDPVKSFSTSHFTSSINTSNVVKNSFSISTFNTLPQTASVSFNLPLKQSSDNETIVTLSIPKTSTNTLTTKFSNISSLAKISESSTQDKANKPALIFSAKSTENYSLPTTSTAFNSLASSTGSETHKFSSKLSPPLPSMPVKAEDKSSPLKVQNPPAIFSSLSNVNSSTNICKTTELFSNFSFGEELAKQFNTTTTASSITTTTTVATIVTQTPIVSAISPTTTVSISKTNESVSNTSFLNDFKFSGFGAKQTNSIPSVSNVNDNKNLLANQQPKKSQPDITTTIASTTSSNVANEVTFSFNNTLSLLSSPLSTSSSTVTTTTTSTSVSNETKTNLVSVSSVSQPTNAFSSTNSSLFGQTTSSFNIFPSNSSSNLLNFPITSPVVPQQPPEQTIQKQSQPTEQANVFSGFGAGISTGIGTSPGSTFSPVAAPTLSTATNFFGQTQPSIPATNSLFSPSPPTSPFSQSVFSVNSPQPAAQPQQQSPFSINQTSSFLPLQSSNSTSSGGNVFGGSPIFGGFSFGGSSFGNMGQQSLKSYVYFFKS